MEDLINREDYLAVLNRFLDQMGQAKRVTTHDVPAGVPIAKAFTDWTVRNKIRAPGKVEVAYALLRAEVRLTQSGRRALASLHGRFAAAFQAVPE